MGFRNDIYYHLVARIAYKPINVLLTVAHCEQEISL
jgi:hypothetical protein